MAMKKFFAPRARNPYWILTPTVAVSVFSFFIRPVQSCPLLLSLDLLPWTCTKCHVVVHSRCMSLPSTVHLPLHDHPLIHTYFIPQSQSIDLFCKICNGKGINREFGCYSCQNCPCIVHVDCAVNNVQEVGKKFWAERIFEATEDQLLEQEIEHFSHPHHKLFLVPHDDDDDDHEIETKCDGCMRLISCPFYKCLECDFSLHNTCSKLPKQINYPLHKKHLLTLVPIDDIAFCCSACRDWCHGFSYRCLTCNDFKIDVRCALVNPFEFYYDSHQHPLGVFTQGNEYCSLCTSCGKYGNKYKLLRCKQQRRFALDYGCATLTRKVKYEFDEHPLVLSYHGNDDSNGFLYCDICEKDRHIKHWFYACPNYSECPIYVHPKCILGGYPYIKLGTSIMVSRLHEHEVVFISKNKDFFQCHLCSKNDRPWSLKCCREDCNFWVHCKCAFRLRKY